jgi:perosamine synthetase
MVALGYNYRLNDLQCALGTSQLRRLPASVSRRQEIAQRYREGLGGCAALRPLEVRDDVSHAYHLFVIQTEPSRLTVDRDRFFAALRAEGIGANVHYVPVHLHPYYQERLGTGPGLCPVAEAAYERIVSLPMFAAMSDHDVADVLAALSKVVAAFQC